MEEKQEKTMHLFLTHRWFDEIAAGRKNVEYRQIKMRRNFPQHYIVGNKIVFHRGYSGITLTAKIECLKIVDFCFMPAEVQEFFSDKQIEKFLAIGFKILPVNPCDTCKKQPCEDQSGWPCSAYWCYFKLNKKEAL